MSTVLRASKKRVKKASRVARAKKLNDRIPIEKEYFRKIMRDLIIVKLYGKQLRYWNRELAKLSELNAISQGRQHDGVKYAIFWNNKKYAPRSFDIYNDSYLVDTPIAEKDQKAYCLPLNPRIKEYAVKMKEIAEELDEILDEKYEVERFFNCLFTFDIPSARLESILGATLFRIIKSQMHLLDKSISDTWNDNSEFGARTFVEANQEIIKKANERVMLNIVTV